MCVQTGSRIPSANPPGNLPASSVPQFVSFGFDDNSFSDGVYFILNTFNSRNNPAGSGRAATFDGAPALVTFYLKGDNIADNEFEDNFAVKRAWHEAMESGNEVAVHTFSHPHGVEFDFSREPPVKSRLLFADDWRREIKECIAWLMKPWNGNVLKDSVEYGIGAQREDIVGFRTPYLEYNDDLFTAVSDCGLKYEAAIEEGWQSDQDGTNCLWPYTLENGSPGDVWVSKTIFGRDKPEIGSHPGIMAMPIYTLIAPPDELCEAYGTRPGLRERMKAEVSYFDVFNGKFTGVDWNIWFEYFMNADDALAVLKYTFDLRYRGNRCPFLFGVHSDIYSDRYDSNCLDDGDGDAASRVKADAENRRATLEKFLDYILTFPEVRVTSMKNVLGWLENPSAL